MDMATAHPSQLGSHAHFSLHLNIYFKRGKICSLIPPPSRSPPFDLGFRLLITLPISFTPLYIYTLWHSLSITSHPVLHDPHSITTTLTTCKSYQMSHQSMHTVTYKLCMQSYSQKKISHSHCVLVIVFWVVFFLHFFISVFFSIPPFFQYLLPLVSKAF